MKSIKDVRLPKNVIPEKYDITLTPDLSNFTFVGEETIFIEIFKSTKEIILHAAELRIKSAEFRDNQETLKAKISYDKKNERVTFSFPKSLKIGNGELRINFTGILNDKLVGFYRSKYFVDGQEKFLATTQFESTDARRAIPCFDEPSHKALFDVSFIIPAHLTAISNTLEKEISDHAPGFKKIQFETSPKMSTYLLAFLIGEFESIEGKTKRGVRVRVFGTPGKKSQLNFALEVGIKCVEFFEKYFDIPYPLPVMDLIAVPDFASGAMENWGAITFRETALLIDEDKSGAANRQRVAVVIAHEIAHMWFGDLVTMEWWTHLWLNEGFASYMEYVAVDAIFPEWDLWTQFIESEMGTALALDSLKNTHPIEVEVHHPDEISEIFDMVSYAKGATVIRMIAEYLGAKDFRDGLRLYLKTHSYSNASTEDLWRALEKVSGKPVGKIMKNWTAKAGYPVITVEEGRDNLILTQNRFFSSPLSKKQTQDQTIWNIPLSIQVEDSKKPINVLMDKKTLKLPKVASDKWIKINSNETSFVRVDYPATLLHQLREAIEKKEISTEDRLGIVRDLFDLSESGNVPTHEALRLATSFKDEVDFTVWMSLATGIAEVGSLIERESFFEEYKSFGREIFSHIADRLGWEKKKGEGHTDSLLRSLVLSSFGKYGNIGTIKQAKNLFKNVLKGDKVDPDLLGVIYNLVARNSGEKEYLQLMKLYRKTDNHQEKDRIMRALTLFSDKNLINQTLDFSLSDEVRSQDGVFIIRALGMNPQAQGLVWKFIQKNWTLIEARYTGGHLLERVIQALNDFSDSKKADSIEAFFKNNTPLNVKRTLQQTLERIRSRALWLERDKKGIKKFLEDYK